MDKQYYTMGEVSQILGEQQSLVRFWANTFSNYVHPMRNNKGNRLFTPEDVDTLKLIHYLVKDKGLTLDGVSKRLKDNREGDDKTIQVIQSLESIRTQLEEIRKML